jgi:prophage tail gpP-like protein
MTDYGTLIRPPAQPVIVANQREIATLEVGGMIFTDWETIWLQHRLGEANPIFRFTTAERDPPPVPPVWQKLQWHPGQACSVLLGGVPAFAGYIITRQVAYDAKSHAVELTGKGVTYWGYESSVDTVDNKGNYDGMAIADIFKKALSKYPGGKQIWGMPNPRKFVNLSANPGEKNWDFLERIARPRGMVLGSDFAGNFLLIGLHQPAQNYSLIEGVNIKKLQCIITKDYFKTVYGCLGQCNGSDEQHGPAASEQEAYVGGSADVKSELHTPAEQPVTGLDELAERAGFEKVWTEGAEIECHATVQGWFPPGSDDIWRVGANVYIKSPMALLDRTLKIQTATFTQDNNGGTQTDLELVLPSKLRGVTSFGFNDEQDPNQQIGNVLASPTPDQQLTPLASPFEAAPQQWKQWQSMVAGMSPLAPPK